MCHKLKFLFSIPLATITLISPFALSSCGNQGIVFANFESYMSPQLMKELHRQHQINFVNYSTNEDILAKFANSYDIAVPSTYSILELIKKGLLGGVKDGTNELGIDWKYLGKRYQLTANPERLESEPVDLINNAKPKSDGYNPRDDSTNAQCLFSDTIDNVIDSIDKYSHENGYYKDEQSILQFAIPYFLQDWMFAYHGDYIDELPSSNLQEDDNNEWYSAYEDGTPVTWNDIIREIGNKDHDPDPRFNKNGNRPQLTMVDDSRTVYDMAHLIYDTQSGISPPGINPTSKETSLTSIEDVYSRLTDKFTPNTFRLNSDSQQVLYSFAKPDNPDDAKFAENNGIIAYNGDILYAAMGAGIDQWEDAWYCDPEGEDEYPLIDGNFHIVKLKDTPIALDMVVVNKKINNSSKKNEVYDVLNKVLLEGADLPCETEEESDQPWIGSSEDDEFVYGPTLNFDYVSYTPPLWNLNTFVAREVEKPNEYNSYFDMLYPVEAGEPNNKAELLAEINNVNFVNNGQEDDARLLEIPLSDLVKSDMSFLWMEYKEKI